MGFANRAIMVALPSIFLMMMITTTGMCKCECDHSSLPLLGVEDADYAPHHHGCETMMGQLGDFGASRNKTTSCGMNHEARQVVMRKMKSLDNVMMSSDAPGSFIAEMLIPLMIFFVFIVFGVSFITYVIIPLIGIMLLFSLYNP